MYIRLFGEVKILKGNLIELPFPQISEKEDKQLSSLVDEVLDGNSVKQDIIENTIFSIYDLSEEQIHYVRRIVNGKAN